MEKEAAKSMEECTLGSFCVLFKRTWIVLHKIRMFMTQRKVLCLLLALLVSEVSSMTCVPDPDYDYDFLDEGDTSVEKANTGKALKAKKGCYKPNKTKTFASLGDGYIPVECGRCSIFGMDIMAWRSERENGDKACWGLTPDLLTSSLDCMWKSSCKLQYEPSIIVWSPPKERSCVAEIPDSLELGYSCLDPGTPVNDVMTNYQSVESLYGLVRSHEYDKKNMMSYPTGAMYPNKYVLYISPPADDDKASYVLLQVLNAQINSRDRLTVQGDSPECKITAWMEGDDHNLTTRTLRLDLVINTSSRTEVNGFEICFQWFAYEDDHATAIFDETIAQCLKAQRGSDFPIYDVIKTTGSQHFSGIIRSHQKFPWNYPRPRPTSGRELLVNTWSSVYHDFRRPQRGIDLRLRLQLKRFDLAWGDSLEINGDKKVTEFAEDRTYDFKGENVTLKFNLLHSSHHSSTGFLLCYRWYELAKKNTLPTNLCADFVYKFDGCKKTGGKQIKKICKVKRKKRDKNKKRTKKKGKRRARRHQRRNKKGEKST